MAEQIVQQSPGSAVPDMREAAGAAGRGMHNVWLVGSGAIGFAVDGVSTLFSALAKKGEQLEPASRKRLQMAGETVGGAVSATTAGVKGKFEDVGTGIRKFATRSEEEGAKTLQSELSRLGVPSRDEWNALSAKLDRLASSFDQFRQNFEPVAEAAKTTKEKKKEEKQD